MARQFQSQKSRDSYVPGNSNPHPEIQTLDRSLPVIDGKATIHYQLHGDESPRQAEMPVSGSDIEVTRITPLDDGRVMLATGPYGNVHCFDPKTGAFEFLGSPASRNVYALAQIDGKFYFAGYPNGAFGSMTSDGAKLIGEWHGSIQSKHTKFILQGADGRIYSGNHNERESTGGGLGWFDPTDGKFGGIQFPHDDCEYLTTAMGGKYVVYASDFTFVSSKPELASRDGRLIIYDTSERKVVRQFSPLRDGSAGVMVETEPGMVLGIGRDEKVPMLYLANVESGTVEKKVPLPGPAPRFISRGPDGNVYFFIREELVRVNPTTFEFETLCPAKPGRMAFLGSDLYLTGTAQLRRIRKISGK